MSNWKDKSESNILAAEKLIESSLTNQSVHCSYYSCVQYVYHVMCSSLGMDAQGIEDETYKKEFEAIDDKKIGTHVWLRNEIFKSLRNRKSDDAEDFNEFMTTLCRVRVIADYKQEIVLGPRARGLFEKAGKTLELLKRNYDQ